MLLSLDQTDLAALMGKSRFWIGSKTGHKMVQEGEKSVCKC